MQEASRREKRRLLDAQRGRCRVRLGSHLDEWCALKDHLGFSLHSQLAKFLLDSYRTSAGLGTPVPKPISLLSVSIPSLHRLVYLCQQHGRTCNSFPTILTKSCSLEAPETARLLWGCKEDHQFYWDPHDCSAGLGGNSTEEDVTGLPLMQPNRTMRQENVPEMSPKEGPVMTAEEKVVLQRPELEPHSTAMQERLYEESSRSDTSPNASPDCVNIEAEQCDDAERIAEGIHTTSANDWPLEANVSEKQQEQVTDEVLCLGHEILVSSAEVGGTEDASPQIVEVSEDTLETISMDLTKKKPKGEECKKSQKKPSEYYQQAIMSQPKAALSFTCRRSPRSSKGCRTKADVTVEAPISKVRSMARGSSAMKGQNVEVLVGSAPNTDTSQTMSLVQESLTGNIPRQKLPSEDLEGLATVAQKEPISVEPQSDGIQIPRALERDVLNTQLDDKRQEPQSTQCRGQKAVRRKALIDEELAQICKKRIRKASAQELLMCEYDDCGKIFSKRQYLNYHQKYQHMNQRTFCCSVTECGKTFNFKKHLKEHEKRHSDRRDFICEFCARAFRSSSNLIIHRRIHTGEKPLQCEFCGFTCRQKASLNWHMKKHDADSLYKFPCDICGQRFEKRDNLAAHKSRKHPAPREAGPQDTTQCATSSLGALCHIEASSKDDSIVTKDPDQEVVPAAPEGIKETLFPGYLDLTNSMQEVSQQTTAGNTGISLVIVL